MDCSLTPIIFNSIHIENSEKYIFQPKNGCKHYKIVGVCSKKYVESEKMQGRHNVLFLPAILAHIHLLNLHPITELRTLRELATSIRIQYAYA